MKLAPFVPSFRLLASAISIPNCFVARQISYFMFSRQTAEEVWIGLEGGDEQCGEASYPGTDCTGKATWVDGSLFNEAEVPEVVLVIHRLTDGVRYLPSHKRLDDQLRNMEFKYLCECSPAKN